MNLWLERALEGDTLAVQKLILLHHPRLKRIALRRMEPALRAKLEPEDVLQDVYAEVVRRRSEFQPRGRDAFFRWLVSILEYKLIDARRFWHAQARDVKREVAVAPRSSFQALAARLAVDVQTPSFAARRTEQHGLLLAALAGLSADHRQVLELRFFHERPLAEVARIMGRSPGAVQMLSARALTNLRAAMKTLSRPA